MVENLLPADWVLLGLAVVAAVLGLFRGFSGTLGFAVALIVAICSATFGWQFSADFTQVVWMRGAGTLVATLLAFGLARLVVKKLVNGLVGQPTDAIFGLLVGFVTGLLPIAAWAWIGEYLEYSFLASEVAKYVG